MASPLERVIARSVWIGECLVWQGSGPREYGTIWSGEDGRKVYVHRLVYERTVGPIPDGMEIDHVAERGCTFKRCVNPAHLEPVTHSENRRRSRLLRCRSGKHDLTDPTNVTFDKAGNRRGCAACRRERALEAYYRSRPLPQ